MAQQRSPERSATYPFFKNLINDRVFKKSQTYELQSLGVAFGEEPVTLAAQLASQFTEIVDAAVEDEAKAEFIVDHRLLGGGREVEDAQAAVAEGHRALRKNA